MENYGADLEKLSKILSTARELKGYSQRKVARLIKTHHSTYNELEKGNIKKPDVDMLRDIAEVLDISLISLLNAAGYSGITLKFREQYHSNKSSKETIDRINTIKKLGKIDCIDRNIVIELIDKILIHENGDIEVIFKYKNLYEDALRYLKS